MQIVASFRDSSLSAYAKRLEALGTEGRQILASALNEGGAALRKHTVAAETRQTGLPADTIERAQQDIPASASRLEFTIRATGGNVRLKYFGATETGGGVTARPWGRSTYYGGAFINSGWRGKRAPAPKLNGHVYRRLGARRLPIEQVRSGLFIPKEMTTGQTAAAYRAGAAVALTTIVARLGSLLPSA